MDTVGAVAGPLLRDPAPEDQMDKIFTECNRPMFFRIWDTSNNYTLYKFENVGPHSLVSIRIIWLQIDLSDH